MTNPKLKLLFVCSRNRWRSPTAERIFARSANLAVRSRGLAASAVRRLTAADVAWADVVLVMESDQKRQLVRQFRNELADRPVHVLDIPDEFAFMDPELIDLLESGVRAAPGVGAVLDHADPPDRGAATPANRSSAYDLMGVGYSSTRQPDPRIAQRIDEALGDASSVVNVGAGTGSYEPRGRRVVAVEPSATMIRQRPAGPAWVLQGIAERLPLGDAAVDAALATLTVHHWTDPARGLAEMRRVARRRVVILTWDQEVWETFWLIREYNPAIAELDRRRALPISRIVHALGRAAVIPVPIPHDCLDGFHGAFWRRPTAYLDPRVRSGISTYAALPPPERDAGLAQLTADISSGAWLARHRHLMDLDELDLGYRLIVAS